jgi:cohesin loading factor subunit SCC2
VHHECDREFNSQLDTQSFPVIVALETSASTGLSSRANSLHAILHSKHTSLLNTRYIVSARASFDYQKKLCAGPVQGYRMQPIPTALLQRWYSLVREKRASRQDFLKALVKVFDVNSDLKSSQVLHFLSFVIRQSVDARPKDDLDFTRYMAENFSAFDYKTQEEVFTVIKHLTSVLSTAGMQLVEVLSPSNLLAQLHGPIPTEPVRLNHTEQ